MLARILNTPKKRIAAAGVGMLLLVGAVAVFALGGDETAAPTTTTTTTTIPPTTTSTTPPPVAPLTGEVGIAANMLARPAVFVKIDNAPQARPHSGLLQADIVFEERVEGNTSRLAAVFQSRDAVEIGPVRSVRTTDLQLVTLFGRPIFASSGANNNVLNALSKADVVDVGHNVSGGGFRRMGGRPAPHNLFTSLDALYAKTSERPPPPKQLFTYREEGAKPPSGARAAKEVVLSFGGPPISRFVWDGPSGQWHRYHGRDRHLDAAGKPVAPRNVVVLEIRYEFSAATGNSRPHGVLAGFGRCLVMTGGNAIGGKWVRPTPKSPLQILDNNGNPIALTPGQTFIELVPAGGFSWR